ncbi:pyridoxal-phosphate dependent enzyme [Hahella sp. HN01]|uniref:1-aminocyclopropane-1-carboxylate deaminase/D-cysteine desulfhydrase n=1 Tax=Hahella sp. HN01 TaxID=2847262 RepID=UPI001C1EDC60|nr:pyridoxal-phosphate dependent enzyme [Hahella sp. HN01]
MSPLLYQPDCVIQPLSHPVAERAGVRLWMARGDLVHESVSGNKWFKLKYSLLEAERSQASGLLSFGGAYSNHLHALAAAGRMLNIPTFGVVRGAWRRELTPTLQDAQKWGMRLLFVSNEAYRCKDDPAWVEESIEGWRLSELIATQKLMVIPEGGSNALALKGVSEWAQQIYSHFSSTPVSIFLPCGTGGTMAGFVAADSHHELVGVPVLRAGDSIAVKVNELLALNNQQPGTPFRFMQGYEFGGYAKTSPELMTFIQAFFDHTGVGLEPVYTGKMAYAALDWLRRGEAPRGSDVVLVHTGGMQGARGFVEQP